MILKKRIAALLMAGAMVCSALPVNVLAAENPGQNTGGLCEHHPQHTAECGYTEETEETEGTPCNFVCEVCNAQNNGEPAEPEQTSETPLKVENWSFVENPDGEALTEQNGKPAVFPGQGKPSFEQLAELLPREIRAEVKSTGKETLPAQSVTIGISGWSCPEYTADAASEAETVSGEYTFIPQLQEGYAFDENPELTVSFTGISLLADSEDALTFAGNIVCANGIPIVIKENNGITSIYSQDGALLSGDIDVSDRWIYGGWYQGTHSGDTSVTLESGTVKRSIYGGNYTGTLNGNTEVVIKGGKAGWVYGGGDVSTVNGTAKVTIHPGSKIWGNSAGADSADDFGRGTVFGGGYKGSVSKTEVKLLGGDFGWAYGGGENCTVGTTDIQLTGNPDKWCSVYGGGNGGSVDTANLTVRGVTTGNVVFLYGGGWGDTVETANITIGGDCRLSGNIGIYAAGSGEPNSSNTGTVGNASFVIDNFQLISQGSTTVCGPLVGTNVTGEKNVLVTGSQSSTASMQLLVKDIDKVKLEESSVVLLGANPSDPGNPNQPLELKCLEIAGSAEAVFTANNTAVTIKELAGSGTLLFEGQVQQPAIITGVQKVSSTADAPLKIAGRGSALTVKDTVFIKGEGITSAAGFVSGMPEYTAVKSAEGIQMKLSSEAKQNVRITEAAFDKASYAYGEAINISIEAEIADTNEPLAGQTVDITDQKNGKTLVSVILDAQGKANVSLTVNNYVWNVLKDSPDGLLAYYRGNAQYNAWIQPITLTGTSDQKQITLTNADIVLTQEITAPELNKAPTRTLETGDAFFTAEIVWNPDTPVFQPDIAYTAGILLSPKKTFALEHIGTVTCQGKTVTPQKQPDGSLLLPDVKQFSPISSESFVYDTRENLLTSVPEQLTEKFSSVEELKGSLYQATLGKMADISESSMLYYDVQLMVSTDGGATWEEALPGYFPSEGVEITLPYPDGTKASTHDFVAAHMLTRSANGQMPGFIEFPTVQETSAGITFRVDNLSPVSIGWKQVAQEPDGEDKPSSGGTESQDENKPSSGGTESQDENKPSSGGSESSNESSRPSQSKTKNSSANSSSAVISRPKKNDTNTPTEGKISPLRPNSDGSVTVKNKSVQSAVRKAEEKAKKNAATKNGVSIIVPVKAGRKQSNLSITIPAETLDTLVREKVKRFTIDTDWMADFGFSPDALNKLSQQTDGDIILKLKKTTVSSADATAAIGNRPVYDISLWEVKNGKETRLTNLTGIKISVAIPYTPAEDESTGNLYSVYVDENGKVEWLTRSDYEADQKAVIFEAEHFSIYGVGYKDPVPEFTDITGHWAADNIVFAAGRGLISGTGDSTFSPNIGMTRGMFVTALGRLEGIDPDSYKTGKFTDVEADAYYAPYVNWAAQTGIVEGITDTVFAPDTNITREQMAVMMKNYADRMGYDLTKTLRSVTFADNAKISSQAKDAVKSLQQAGILVDKLNNQFSPRGTATRAEAASVLRRFVEIVIDPGNANGWIQDDRGEWSYYKNGEMVKGWLSNDGKSYWLDKTTGKMFSGGWKQIKGKYYYFYADGSMAVSTKVDGYQVGADGARK